jgi:7-keto-8-aminopelargonate synthetase-like enzyme
MDHTKLLAGKTVRGPVSARMNIDGRDYINFCGTAYLALSRVPELRAAARLALEEDEPFARHTPASLGAPDPAFDTVERAVATACGAEASVYFSSGYLIGSVGLATLNRSFDLILIDEIAHHSLVDAARLSGLPTFAFPHCDVDAMSEVLNRELRANQRPLLLTDGVFAMSGRIPPLAEYAGLLAVYEGFMFVDESHGFGTIGEHGRGAVEYCGVEPFAAIGSTLSKSCCAQGAFVACSSAAAARARAVPPISGACAGSPLSARVAAASLAYMATHPELRKSLAELTRYLRSRLRSIGLDVIDSPAPIVSFQCGNRASMQSLQQRAFERGIHISHSAYVGAGADGMIRCAVFSDHTRDDIDRLIDALAT